MSWKDAPAPALVAKHLLDRVLGHEVSPRYARFLNNATHWGFGLATGAGYGLLGARRRPKVWFGLPFGAAVWASGYIVLPLLGVYEPIWKYDLETLRKDLSAHLVFGTATAQRSESLPLRSTSDARPEKLTGDTMDTTLGTTDVATDESVSRTST